MRARAITKREYFRAFFNLRPSGQFFNPRKKSEKAWTTMDRYAHRTRIARTQQRMQETNRVKLLYGFERLR
jgi:hypothetical protein